MRSVENYRGFRIVVEPIEDRDDLWDFEYAITRIDDAPTAQPLLRRSRTLGGYVSADVACLAGIEVGRTEVDNHLAQEGAPGVPPTPGIGGRADERAG